jgi:hypothetical protein
MGGISPNLVTLAGTLKTVSQNNHQYKHALCSVFIWSLTFYNGAGS